MTMESPPQCQPDAIGPFRDHTLSPDQMAAMGEHLAGCPVCRERMHMEETISQLALNVISRASAKVDFVRLEAEILRRFRQGRAVKAGQPGSRERWWFFNRFLLPTLAVATLGVAMVSVPGSWIGGEPEPSAIVRSFSGEVQEVMIMETPVLKQTVIWFQEPGDVEAPTMEPTDGSAVQAG